MSNQRRFALLKQHEIGTAEWNEAAQDAIGTILADSSEINFTYNDATPSITAALIDGSIAFARLQNADAVSVLGRSANSAGVLDEIAAGANDRILRRTSDALNFGQLTAGMFPNTVVPDAALSSNVPLLNAANVWTADPATGPGASFRASGGGTDAAIQIMANQPSLNLWESDAAANNKSWDFSIIAGVFQGRLINDANSAATTWLSVTRSDNTATAIDLTATAITLNSVNITDYARLSQENTFSRSENGSNETKLDNTSTGSGAFTQLTLSSGAGGDNRLFRLYVFGNTYTAIPALTGSAVIQTPSSNSLLILDTSLNSLASFSTPGSGQTALSVYDNDNATLERVSVGAADSGGSGFKVLRIPN